MICQILYSSYLREESLVRVEVLLQNLQQVKLKKGTEIRDFWEKLPQPLDFNIYVLHQERN